MLKLYSVADVRGMWPDPKPLESNIKTLAKRTGFGRKLGRSWAFTEADIEGLLCSLCVKKNDRRTGTSVARSRVSESTKALERLTERRLKDLDESARNVFIRNSSLESVQPLLSPKR